MYQHRINTRTKNMAFCWRSPWGKDWDWYLGTVPTIFSWLNVDPSWRNADLHNMHYYWTYCGVRIEAFEAKGQVHETEQDIHLAMQNLTLGGGIGYFKTEPTRRNPNKAIRKSFTLSRRSAEYLARFENQSAEVERLIAIAAQK